MKKIIPYLISLCLGFLVAFILFDKNANLISKFKETLKCTGFQLGVYNSLDLANDMTKKYPSSVIIKDEDVYRVYISILTNKTAINKMEDYLNNEKIAFYEKDIEINDKGIIDALNKYEKSMIDAPNNTFISLNKLIMDEYGGKI